MDDGDDNVAGAAGGAAEDLWEPVPPPAQNDDDDDAPAEEEEEEEDPQIIEEVPRNGDGSLDGGEAVMEASGKSRRRSSQCDLVLYLECIESSDEAPNHHVLKPGVTVSIGLDKSTKLSAVFVRYVEFCNEQHSTNNVQTSDLEFVHCTLLNATDTVEASALMKNDRIKVRRIRTSEREAEAEQARLQRESDREYFKRLRLLLPDMIGTKNCDVLLDCRGKLVDENGLNQEVLRTGVRGHSAILSKRCKWLGRIIQCARDELERRSVITIPDNDGGSAGAAGESGQESPTEDDNTTMAASDNNGRDVMNGSSSQENVARRAAAAGEEDDDDGFEVLAYPINQNQQIESRRVVGNGDDRNGGAAEIENDDDDDDDHRYLQAPQAEELENSRSGSPVISSTSGSSSLLWVTLPNHPPEAVKLLLEYCYTNRVIPLGHDAFMGASRSRQEHNKRDTGPVPPYPSHSQGARRWPNNGLPTVSFSVALAGIALAEEASMPRLSLMCEVAASQLVSQSNFVEALTTCTTQQQRTGNALPRLREATMDILLRNGQRGVVDLCRTPTFRRALEERSAAVVPSLLVGTMEAVKPKREDALVEQTAGCKRDLSGTTKKCFDMLDREDVYIRETERRKRRIERWKEKGVSPDGMVIGEEDVNMEDMMMLDPLAAMWASEPTKMSLKRMSHHLGSTFSMGRSDGGSSRLSLALLGRRGQSRSSGTSNANKRRRGGRGKGGFV